MSTDDYSAERALQPMQLALEADGYSLIVEMSNEVLHVKVEAGFDACADCLIPKDLMSEMIRSRLEDEQFGMEGRLLKLSYPE